MHDTKPWSERPSASDRDDETVVAAQRAAPVATTGLPGSLISDYRIEQFLASGSCGGVFVATHLPSMRLVAVKVLHEQFIRNARVIERFRREVDIVSQLRHPNIVEVFETGVLADGRPFYAMEYLEGSTLFALLSSRGRFPPEEALELLEPVCAALEIAHAAGVVHRDVKASNVFITATEPRGVKLLDFGVAKLLDTSEIGSSWLTTAGVIVGTFSIMAPEQLREEPIDARTDIYALGAVLYLLLVGRMPFRATTQARLTQMHLEAPVPRPSDTVSVSAELDAVVERAMAKQRERRFASVKSFLDALQNAIRPSAAAQSARTTVVAIALAVHMRVHITADEVDDAMVTEIGCASNLVEQRLQEAGFDLIPSESETFAVLTLPADSAQRAVAIREALNVVAELRAELSRRLSADSGFNAVFSVHIDQTTLRDEATREIVGGALTEMNSWAADTQVGGLYITQSVVQEIAHLAISPVPDDMFMIP